MSEKSPAQLYTVEEVATCFRVDPRTIRRWIAQGEIAAYRFGRQWRIKDTDFQDFAEKHTMITCHDCHMPKTKTRVATMGAPEVMSHQHLFHGAHVPSKLAGAIEMRMHPDRRDVVPGETVEITLYLFNAKAGHMIPSGSAEERVVWLHVEAKDAEGGKPCTFAFTPQDGNSLLSSVAAAVWGLYPETYDKIVQCLKPYFFQEV